MTEKSTTQQTIHLKVKSKSEVVGIFYHYIATWQEVFYGQIRLEKSHVQYLHLGDL